MTLKTIKEKLDIDTYPQSLRDQLKALQDFLEKDPNTKERKGFIYASEEFNEKANTFLGELYSKRNEIGFRHLILTIRLGIDDYNLPLNQKKLPNLKKILETYQNEIEEILTNYESEK